MSARPEPMRNNFASPSSREIDTDTIEEPPPTTPDENVSRRTIETSQPRPRHMRKPSSGSQGGSCRSLNSGKFRPGGSPATQPGTTSFIPRSGRSGVAVKEALAATESGSTGVFAQNSVVDPLHKSSVKTSPSQETVVTASTESFEDYMNRKRSKIQGVQGQQAPDNDEEEGAVDPYAHLRNQPRRPRPEADSTLSPANMDVAFEVVATPVFDDDDSYGSGGGGKRKKKKNPLKDWRVLLFLAVALSAIVGLTVALLMQNNGESNEKTLPSLDGGNDIDSGGSDGGNSVPEYFEPDGENPEDPLDVFEYDGGGIPELEEPESGGTFQPEEPNGSEVSEPKEPSGGDVSEPEEPNSSGVSEPEEPNGSDVEDGNSSGTPDNVSDTVETTTIMPTTSPTTSPTAAPTTVPTNHPTSRPTNVPTHPPTESKSDPQDTAPQGGGVEFELDPFSMLIMSSSEIDRTTLLGVVATHLAEPIKQEVPNFGGMRLNVDVKGYQDRNRRLRSLQTNMVYDVSIGGHIILKDLTYYPTSWGMEAIIKEAFSGKSLDEFTKAMEEADIDVAAIVVKDAAGVIIGANDSDEVLGPNIGILKTPLSNRFSRSGAMFDITAKDFPVTITSIDVHIDSTERNIPIEVWTRSGSYIGYEGGDSEWKHHEYIIPTGLGIGKMTPIPKEQFEAFTIPKGQTVGVYITLQESKGMLLGQSSSLSSTKDDPYLKLSPALSVGFRFGETNPDRAWGGAIRYEIPL